MAVRREYVADLYRNVLGREGSEDDIAGHLSNPGGEKGLYDLFQSVAGNKSDGRVNEATVGSAPQQTYQSYYDVQGTPPPSTAYATQGDPPTSNTGTPRSVIPVTPTVPPAPAPPSPAPYTGFQPKYDYSAFNTARGQDPAKSAKDAFAMLSNQAPPPPFQDRAGLASWFKQYIQPGMDALGHKVLSVDGDSFTYSNQEGTFRVDYAQNAGAAPGSMLQRLQWGADPGNEETRLRYATTGGGTTSGGTTSGGRTSGGSARTGAGSSSTIGDLRSVYSSLGQQYAGPGGQGITNGPLQQVGQDPLSLLISGALAKFTGDEGSTGFGRDVQSRLLDQLDRGGDIDQGAVNRRYESARELMDKGRRTMANDLRGDLANRNLLSEPGISQGAEIGGLERISEKIAPEFSRALRDIYTDEAARADTRLMTSLQMATGFSTDQARNLLAGIGEGTARQTALADIALRSLQQNQAWSMFLAQYGLERDKVMYDIQNGQINQILPILQAFLQLGGMANQGYV